jgi:hypothetical protein
VGGGGGPWCYVCKKMLYLSFSKKERYEMKKSIIGQPSPRLSQN